MGGMGERRKCVKCGGILRSNTGPDECWNCRSGKPAKPKADEAPPSFDAGEVSRPDDPVRQFHQLADALGLNPAEMIETFCREWVEKVRRRALEGETTPAREPAGE